MTRPRRWDEAAVAELKRRHTEDGISWRQLGIEHGVSRQCIWGAVNRGKLLEGRKNRKLARKTAKLADVGS